MDEKIETVFASIIVPVYNRKKSIKKCLNSILNQSFENFELIVIDDGSDDGTGEICDFYEKTHSKIKVIHQKNKGVSGARNIGIKNATGEVCLFVDSDDYISSSYLQQIKCAYDKFGRECFFVTSYKLFSKDQMQRLQYAKDAFYSVLNGYFFFELINKGLFNAVNNKVYQLSVIKKYMIQFPLNIDLGEDLIFNLIYLDHISQIKVICLNRCYYYYYCDKNKNSLESKWREDYFEIQLYLLKRKIRYLKRWLCDGRISQKEIDGRILKIYKDFFYDVKIYYIRNIKNMSLKQMVATVIKILFFMNIIKKKYERKINY